MLFHVPASLCIFPFFHFFLTIQVMLPYDMYDWFHTVRIERHDWKDSLTKHERPRKMSSRFLTVEKVQWHQRMVEYSSSQHGLFLLKSTCARVLYWTLLLCFFFRPVRLYNLQRLTPITSHCLSGDLQRARLSQHGALRRPDGDGSARIRGIRDGPDDS